MTKSRSKGHKAFVVAFVVFRVVVFGLFGLSCGSFTFRVVYYIISCGMSKLRFSRAVIK